jgi:hypothetical protein
VRPDDARAPAQTHAIHKCERLRLRQRSWRLKPALLMSPDSILENADRLISDARFMHEAGRSRSAATLIVVALEQMGSYVEELTGEKYPDAVVHMGIFGDSTNAHSRRQDALAGHVVSVAMGDLTTDSCGKFFLIKRTAAVTAKSFFNGSGNPFLSSFGRNKSSE